jgi:hypothetical protein
MRYFKLLYVLFLSVGIVTCRDAEIQPKDYPTVTTTEATNIDVNGVTLNAIVNSSGTQAITDYGFIVTSNDVQNEYSLGNSLKKSSFETRITSDLDSGVVYRYKAFMRTKNNLVLGNELEFLSKGSGEIIITGMNPTEGFKSTTVKISGQNFSKNKNNTKVFVNNQSATIVSTTENDVEFIIPNSLKPGEYEVKLVIGLRTNILTQKFKIVETKILSVQPLSGTPGMEISITGENLLRGSKITADFGGIAASISFLSETLVKVIVPVYMDLLLSDSYLDLTLIVDGMKIVYPKKFIVKKTWDIKQPPIKESYPINYEMGFSYMNYGYLHDRNKGDMYRYDPTINNWEKVPNSRFTGSIYENSLYIPVNNLVYRVGGLNYLGNLNSLWCYNVDNNIWSQKPNLPFNFSDASFFVLNNKIFILTLEKQLWKCDFENNIYVRLKDFPDSPADFFLSTFIANNQVYAVQYGKTWLYDSLNDNWTFIASNPFSKETYSVNALCYSNKDTGYVFNRGQFLWKFNASTNLWNLVSIYPGIRGDDSKKSIFIINNKAYFAAVSGHYYESHPLLYVYSE